LAPILGLGHRAGHVAGIEKVARVRGVRARRSPRDAAL